MKKSVDICFHMWYYNKAVTRELLKQQKTSEVQDLGKYDADYIQKVENKKSLKKCLTNALRCDKIYKSPNERVKRRGP